MLLKLSFLTLTIGVFFIGLEWEEQLDIIDHYEEGLQVAQQEDKPIFLLFTAHSCSNNQAINACLRDNQEIINLLHEDFITIRLRVDDSKPLAKVEKVEIEGKQISLKTYGQKWAALEKLMFDQNVQPLGVILDQQGNQLSETMAYNALKDRLLFELQNNR